MLLTICASGVLTFIDISSAPVSMLRFNFPVNSDTGVVNAQNSFLQSVGAQGALIKASIDYFGTVQDGEMGSLNFADVGFTGNTALVCQVTTIDPFKFSSSSFSSIVFPGLDGQFAYEVINTSLVNTGVAVMDIVGYFVHVT